jgi:hypothetical protein
MASAVLWPVARKKGGALGEKIKKWKCGSERDLKSVRMEDPGENTRDNTKAEEL